MTAHLRFMVMAAALAMTGGAARADAIDGNWCREDGRRISIDGPKIVTPGGSAMTGDYSRHGFNYMAPASEPEGGAAVVMVLRGEHRMLRRVGEGPQEEWRRCPPGIS